MTITTNTISQPAQTTTITVEGATMYKAWWAIEDHAIANENDVFESLIWSDDHHAVSETHQYTINEAA